jgi:hypothetical protein
MRLFLKKIGQKSLKPDFPNISYFWTIISKITTRPLPEPNGDPKWIVFVSILSPRSRLISPLAGLWVPFLEIKGGKNDVSPSHNGWATDQWSASWNMTEDSK